MNTPSPTTAPANMAEQVCGLYATNPLLKNVRTQYDLQMNDVYCTNAVNTKYGPNPMKDVKVPKRHPGTPYMPLANAYMFSPGSYFTGENKPANYN